MIRSDNDLAFLANSLARPRLLVSVRSEVEAIAAQRGGADIIDIKDPSRGSLGRASIEVMKSVVSAIDDVPVTAALGELVDLDQSEGQQLGGELQEVGLCLVKVGTSHLSNDPSAHSRFDQLREEIERQPGGPRLIPAAYADNDRCGAPSIWEVFEWAKKTTARLLLVDTFVKDGRGFRSWIDQTEYRELLDACRESRVGLAIAGSLGEAEIEELLPHSPDVIAVRGAACAQNQRQSTIEEKRVRKLHLLLRSSTASR